MNQKGDGSPDPGKGTSAERKGGWCQSWRSAVKKLNPHEDLEFDHVTVHGIHKVKNPDLPWPRRLVWLALLLAGLSGLLYLVTDQLLQYLSRPIRVQVSIVQNETLTLPAITICLREKYDHHNLLRLWKEHKQQGKLPPDADLQLLARTNLTLTDIWQRGGYDLKDLVKQCFTGPGGKCEAAGAWSSVLTRYGLCYTYSGASARMGGKLFGVYLRLGYRGHPYGYNFGGYTVAVHNPLVPVTQAIENGFNCMQKLTKDKKKLGCHRLILVAVQKIKLINRRHHECSPHPLYNTEACRSTCLYRHVVHRHGCKLPYMNVGGPECRTPAEVRAVERSMKSLFFYGHFNYTPCGCVPECFSVIYRQNTDTTWNTNRNAIMKVYFAGTKYEEVVESYSFSFSNLVSRIGGFMGLLLGASVLSLLQAGELILHKARRALYWVLCAVVRRG